MTKLQQAQEAAERAQQAAKEAAELVLELVLELEKEAEPSVWVHEYEKQSYYIKECGDIDAGPCGDAGPLNSFPDKETAERIRDWMALMDRMRIAAGGYEWEKNTPNYSLYWDFSNNEIGTTYHIDIKYFGHIYFPSQQSTQDFINSMTEHEKEVFKRGFPVY
jgi:hypothetical protein